MEHFKNMFNHLYWSNNKILECLHNNDNKNARRLFAHILYAEQVWFARLKKETSPLSSLWVEDINVAECAKLAYENELSYTTYINQLNNSDLEQSITYQNSQGLEFETPIKEVLTHVVLHGQYHRGQINLHLRINGDKPVNVDYITYNRNR
ncbi:DinB family protein [Alkalibacillus salilacus]|uniref:Damage-inducible protein DinB n=1 Tax=Alkalibacillus salilacus TaxID=284582 RepID=A0ABT9VDE5_9BACI|nr:DinB family protein [Alkalibacillus salilacus]MDQ0158942.1 putative damage-inducible protein DinB [Alkalibacillus salilacus]